MEFEIRRFTEDDWQAYRDHRLEMLADTPMAYNETLATAQLVDEKGWRERAGRGNGGTGIHVAAITADGEWVGSMGGFIQPGGGPVLFGVYVKEGYRGERPGVTSALMDAVDAWAIQHSPTIRLEVHELNFRARASYAKHGWVETGHTRPYPVDPTQNELEMIKHLG